MNRKKIENEACYKLLDCLIDKINGLKYIRDIDDKRANYNAGVNAALNILETLRGSENDN